MRLAGPTGLATPGGASAGFTGLTGFLGVGTGGLAVPTGAAGVAGVAGTTGTGGRMGKNALRSSSSPAQPVEVRHSNMAAQKRIIPRIPQPFAGRERRAERAGQTTEGLRRAGMDKDFGCTQL